MWDVAPNAADNCSIVGGPAPGNAARARLLRLTSAGDSGSIMEVGFPFPLAVRRQLAPMACERPYEELDHGGDIGLRVCGRSLRELFENAASGMIELMLDPAGVAPREAREIEAEGDDAESLLVAWLSEILYAFDAEGFAPARAEVTSLDASRARGRLWGEDFEGSRHEVRNVIKAVTWHNLEVQRSGDDHQVIIVFDV